MRVCFDECVVEDGEDEHKRSHLCLLPRLMVSAQDGDAGWVKDLQGYQQRNCLHRLKPVAPVLMLSAKQQTPNLFAPPDLIETLKAVVIFTYFSHTTNAIRD